MATASAVPPSTPRAGTRWLFSVRIVTVLSMLLVVAPAVLSGFYRPFYRDLWWIKSYTVLARPVEFGIEWEGTGEQNYFTDQSGIIRRTSEDRSANATDPPIPLP